MKPFLLLLFLAGCASQPTTYAQGVPVAPRAPAFSPITEAPHTVGQPGHLQPQALPRSPHQRQLPPTKEPGLWAGDGPQASHSSTPSPPELFGVALPAVSTMDGQEELWPARACLALWSAALPGTGLDAKVNALRPLDKRCMVAWMFHDCARVIGELDAGSRRENVVDMHVRKIREQFPQAAKSFVREACQDVPVTAAQRRLLDNLRAALGRSSITSE